MNILVLLRMVPDVVEELEVGEDGKSLNTEYLRLIPSESDDHALEQALLLKEKHGGKVTVLAPEAPEVDEALFAALAKGADRAIKITGIEAQASTWKMAREMAQALSKTPGLLPADLILTGTQAIDDLDGLLAPMLSQLLNLPFQGIVTKVAPEPAGSVTVQKEYPAGLKGEFELTLPAVLGIQAAEKPPRYVPVAKVRAVMKSQKIDGLAAPGAAAGAAKVEVISMAKPVAAGHAEMLEGATEAVATKLCDILADRGLL